ncbi:integrase catalytic domain-containing protein [Trichonephila clavipes]|nr:integrase catalytic domain-containing protein [Trichonephila clavipes]
MPLPVGSYQPEVSSAFTKTVVTFVLKAKNKKLGPASKFKPFVSNRISEIQENTDPASWRHCSGKQNPADLLTRGLTSKELINSEKWWHGPEWLKDSENLWPKLEGFESLDSETVEFKSSLIANLTITHERIIDPDKYSSLINLLRITAYIFRFVNALRRKDIVKGPLAAEELSNAEIFWVKVTQNDFYTSEITCLKSNKTLQKDSKLLCLNPFLDDNGVLRVTGRLGKTTHLSANEKHPIILPSKARLTELLIWESRKRVFHSGVSHTLVQVREKYWILKARQTIKSLLKRCISCKRFNSNPGSQVTAPLPDIRVTDVTVVGHDFAGPLFVKDNDAKQYILLITCAVTRSIHLGLVGSVTTDTFLLVFRRFVARRCLCSMVISDNARTFKRAELELQQMWEVLNHADVKNFYSAHSIKWNYIVERAVWWGGFYECMVRCVKVALRKTLRRSSLTTEQLLTVLTEIEGM